MLYSSGGTDFFYHELFYHGIIQNDGSLETISGPHEVAHLGDMQQQYVSFYGPDVHNIDLWEVNPDGFTQMYFDQLVNGHSKIYFINIPETTTDLPGFLMDTTEMISIPVSEVNSGANDRCPYINGNLMVFTSDRQGGYGGYDLYYSKFNGTAWSEPVNFGTAINTQYDEFRPVSVQVFDFENDLMIFSSNRPGGQGGYDLYYVGIDKINPLTIP
jgi:hypothetical protein